MSYKEYFEDIPCECKNEVICARCALKEQLEKVANTESELRCSIDGNCLSIVKPDFINLAESKSIFIELTPKQIKEIKEF